MLALRVVFTQPMRPLACATFFSSKNRAQPSSRQIWHLRKIVSLDQTQRRGSNVQDQKKHTSCTVDFQVAGTFYKDNRKWGSPHYAFHQEVRPLLPRVQVHHRDPPTQGKALRRPVGNGRRKLLPPGHGSFRRGGAVRRRRGDPAVRRDSRAGRYPRRTASMALGGWRRGLQNVGVG